MTARARSSRSSSDDAAPGPPSHVLVATLGKPHGLRGEIYITVHSDDPSRFASGSELTLADTKRMLVVRRVRDHVTKRGPRAVVSFEGVDDRAAAQALSGRDLVVAVDDLRALGDAEWWDHELIGCTVRTVSGESLGTVADVLHLPANDVLEVGGHLIPLIGDVVREVDPKRRVIVIDPLPGLLDGT